MDKTVTVVFDGEVLRPDAPVDLEPNTRYVITIKRSRGQAADGDAWGVLAEMTGTIDAPPDWASAHSCQAFAGRLTEVFGTHEENLRFLEELRRSWDEE